MKTQSNKLDFSKTSLIELNDNKLLDINGGTTPGLGLALAAFALSYDVSRDYFGGN